MRSAVRSSVFRGDKKARGKLQVASNGRATKCHAIEGERLSGERQEVRKKEERRKKAGSKRENRLVRPDRGARNEQPNGASVFAVRPKYTTRLLSRHNRKVFAAFTLPNSNIL